MSARDVADLLRELKGTTCQCGADKKSMQTFCTPCFFHLPRHMRHALYDKIGEGYEEAYTAALQHVREDLEGKDHQVPLL